MAVSETGVQEVTKLSKQSNAKKCPHCLKSLVLKPKEYLAIRKRLGLTQRAMAARLGVQGSHWAYLEGGKRDPSPTLLAKILKL